MNKTVISQLITFTQTYPLLAIESKLNYDNNNENSTATITISSSQYNLNQEIEILTTVLTSSNYYNNHTIILPSLKYIIKNNCHKIYFNIPYLLIAYYNSKIVSYIISLRLLFMNQKINCINNRNELLNNDELVLFFIIYNYIFDYTSFEFTSPLRYFVIKALDKNKTLLVDYHKIFGKFFTEKFYSFFDELFLKDSCSFDSEFMLFDFITNNKLLINNLTYSSIIIELSITPSYYNTITSHLLCNTFDKQINILLQVNTFDHVLLQLITSQCIHSLIINEYKENGYALLINNNPKEIMIIIEAKVNYNHLINTLQYFKGHQVSQCFIFIYIDDSYYKIIFHSLKTVNYYRFSKESEMKRNRISLQAILNKSNYTLVSYSIDNTLLLTILYSKRIELSMILSLISFTSLSKSNKQSMCFFDNSNDFLTCLNEFHNCGIIDVNNYFCDEILIQNASSKLYRAIEKDACEFPCRQLTIGKNTFRAVIKLKREMRRLLIVFFAIKRRLPLMYKHRLLYVISLFLTKTTIIK